MKDKYTCVAKTLAGLEGPLEAELRAMNYQNIKVLKRAVQFDSDLKGIYLANLNLRTAMSVLVNLHVYTFRNKDDFYNEAMKVEWEKLFDVKRTISIKTAVWGQAFSNSNYPGLLVKDAIADRFRKKFGKRPSVDKERPDVVLDVYVSENRATISLNSNGFPLFQRGYRNMSFIAPLNECLAAGLVYLSGWTPKDNFINPMCGSGTLVTEAAMMAYKMHPQKLREEFAFQNWMNYDVDLFNSCRKELLNQEKSSVNIKIEASDISNRAISITRATLSKLWLDDKVELTKMNFLKAKVNTKDGIVILNPPYDERLKEEDIEELYAEIGRSLKFDYTEHKAFIFSSHIEALKNVGLKTFVRLDLFNGQIPCKYMGYDLYSGSKKD